MRRRSAVASLSAALLALGGLTACSTTQTTADTPSASPATSDPGVDAAAVACEQLITPISIVQNVADAPEAELGVQSVSGLYFTASREFARVGAALEKSELRDQVTSLEDASRVINRRASMSDDRAKWADQVEKISAATQEVAAICVTTDENWYTLGWYGG